MAIETKNLLTWVKAMSRGQALPLDASEVHESLAAAQAYAATATAYAGQSIKAMGTDGKYHEYILQPSTSGGYTLEEVGAIKEEDLKQYVQMPDALPTADQEEGVLYIVGTEGHIWTGTAWKKVFWDLTTDLNGVSGRVKALEENMPNYAPKANPEFTGTIKFNGKEAATQEYVDGLIANLVSDTPGVLSMNGGKLTRNQVEVTVDDVFRAGETYRIADAGEYFGYACEAGDLVIALTDFTWNPDDEPAENNVPPYSEGDVMVVQANIDGAVTSSADATTVGEIVVFDAVTGKIIKGSGVQIASLNDAIAKAHEHDNKEQLDTYEKTQSELLEEAATHAALAIQTHEAQMNLKLVQKADKETTLAGYGITDAYNKTEVDNLLLPITQNLNSKAAAKDVADWIEAAKSETFSDAVAAADENLATRVGDIPADKTIRAYVDETVGAGGTTSAQAIDAAKQEAIAAAKTYTDTALTVTVF